MFDLNELETWERGLRDLDRTNQYVVAQATQLKAKSISLSEQSQDLIHKPFELRGMAS